MRRTSTRVLPATVGVIALMVAGCSVGEDADQVTAGASSATAASPSATAASPSATPGGSPSAGVIPASALLQPTDLNGESLTPLPAGDYEHLRPVRPCGATYPSDANRTAAVAMRANVSQTAGETPSTVIQYVGLHPTDAPAAFAQMAEAVRRCPGSLEPGERRWVVADENIVGDDSLLIRVTERYSYSGDGHLDETTTPVVLARVGDHILVLTDAGWENISGDEAYLLRLAPQAVERLRSAG